jgi:hypothetical protein
VIWFGLVLSLERIVKITDTWLQVKSKSFLRPFRPFFERSIYAKLLEAEQFW